MKPIPSFYQQKVLTLAPQLLGMKICRQFEHGTLLKVKITETEAYSGEEDLACHASKGRSKRTEVMYQTGGVVYVYLIYGKYWLLNIVAGAENCPSAVLIRSVQKTLGPGRVGKLLQLDSSFYGEDLNTSTRLWLETGTKPKQIITNKRIGVEYAGGWAHKPWRFLIQH